MNPYRRITISHSDLATGLGDPGAQVAALNNLARARGAAGEVEEAIQLATKALGISRVQGDRQREAAIHNNLADLLQSDGRSDETMSELKLAVTIFAEIGAEAGDMEPEIWKLAEW